MASVPIPVAAFGQRPGLQGKYTASFWGSETITFSGKDSFNFYGFYCTYGVGGRGRYEIRGRRLYLNFSREKRPDDSVRSPVLLKTPTPDTVGIVTIKCFDPDNRPIAYGSLRLITKTRVGWTMTADSAGQASFRIAKSYFPVILEMTSIGYPTQQLTIRDYSGYFIKIFSGPGRFEKELHNGETVVYKIGKISEDCLSLRTEKPAETFRVYRKMRT